MLRVAVAEARLLFGRKGTFDVLIVGYPGHFDMPAARRIARGKPVVFNPLVSLWDTLVDDRGRFRPGSSGAGVLRRVDRIAFRRADLVVADTEAQARWYAETFGLPASRLAVCLVGAEDRLFARLAAGRALPRPSSSAADKLHGLRLSSKRLVSAVSSVRLVARGTEGFWLHHRQRGLCPWVGTRTSGRLQPAGCALGIFGIRTMLSG